ncbi:MAG: DUF4872 domain-containing protein [Bacteroidales bacterium]|nr:DUF4872 domain-containing protein [Bacteroidales bacterium]
MNIKVDFTHKMAAHCETGTLTGLLNNAGMEITEPMVFGIGQGMFFGYFESKNFPFPTFIVRSKPGEVREKVAKALSIKLNKFTFKDRNEGMKKLDELLAANKAVGTQVDFFYMDYLPDWMRVHINVHFINVIGKNENKYVISDSYFPKVADLDEQLLIKGRWAGGHMAPEGFIYYPELLKSTVDFKKPIIEGIKKSCRNMLSYPIPFIGVKGIYKFAQKIK